MTYEEAKQKIDRLCDEYYRDYKEGEKRGDLSYMYISDGLQMALNILSEVDE